jgi:hypothetical protein
MKKLWNRFIDFAANAGDALSNSLDLFVALAPFLAAIAAFMASFFSSGTEAILYQILAWVILLANRK